MKEIIIKYLNDNEVDFIKTGEDQFEFDIETAEANWKCQVIIKGKAGVNIYSVFPERIPDEQLADSALYLMWLNKERVFGSFELDPEYNQIKFKTYIDCENMEFTARILDRTLFINTASMQKYYSEFMKQLHQKKVA